MLKEFTPNGILYTWELAGSEGAHFILYPADGDHPDKVAGSKAWLRSQHDVVSLRLASDEDRDDLYKSDYFADPRTRELKWYEIEQDEKLIRKHRKAGTPPAEFVEKFVLPFIEQTKQRYMEQYGEKMLNF